MASIEERFQAAVNVIKGLPKNGPYQPSTTMMLKFYGYYKQATEGPCHQKRPGFWDIVGRAKWDAWNGNRHLSKEQAMQKYVDDLREIIETMSFTENVQNFVGSLSGLDNISLDELDMVAPGMREIAESHPNSPFNSRGNSPQRQPDISKNSNVTKNSSNNTLAWNGHNGNNNNDATNLNAENETLIMPTTITTNDTIVTTSTTTTTTTNNNNNNSSNITASTNNTAVDLHEVSETQQQQQQQQPIIAHNSDKKSYNGYISNSSNTTEQSDDEYGDPFDIQNDFTEILTQNTDMLKKINATVQKMNMDIVTVNQRITNLEKSLVDVRLLINNSKKTQNKVSSSSNFKLENMNFRQRPTWWPFKGISPGWFALLILWPFVIKQLTRVIVPVRRK